MFWRSIFQTLFKYFSALLTCLRHVLVTLQLLISHFLVPHHLITF